MKWRRNANLWFIVITVLISVFICIYLIWLLERKDQNEINIITIVGTVLAISALVFTIKEQYRLKKISTAIRDNTREIQEKIIYKYSAWNIEKCSKYINDIQTAANESTDERHPDENDPDATPEDAVKSIEFAKALGEFLFVLPARIQAGVTPSS
jgi:hypothetical protein